MSTSSPKGGEDRAAILFEINLPTLRKANSLTFKELSLDIFRIRKTSSTDFSLLIHHAMPRNARGFRQRTQCISNLTRIESGSNSRSNLSIGGYRSFWNVRHLFVDFLVQVFLDVQQLPAQQIRKNQRSNNGCIGLNDEFWCIGA